MPVQIHTDGTETFTISSGNVTQIAGLTVNGYTPVVGDRILIPNAPTSTGAGHSYSYNYTATGNGIYVVTSLSGGNIAVSRATDMAGSVNPVGLTTYSECTTAGWFGQAVWTVVYPEHPSSWTSYGSKSIRFQPTAGLALGPNRIALATGGDWSLSWDNGTGNTRLNPVANSGDQTLTLPIVASDRLVSRTSTDTLTNKTISGASNTIVTGMLMPVQHHANGGETYTITSGSVTQINGTTIQGQSVSIGDRILVMGAPATSGVGTQYNLTTQPANGIYVVTGNTTNLTVTRATDMSGSVHPAGLSVYSINSTAGWLGQAMFSVALPGTSASFTYGTDSIKWRVSGGASLLPNTVYIANTSHGLGWWNGAYSTYVNPQATTADQDLNLPKQTSDTLLGATNLPAVNGNSAAQQQVVVSGTSYYITGSDLLASPATPISGMVVGTRYVWRVAMTKTAAGTGTFQIVIYRGTNGTTSDTADVTQTIGTQTAAVDNMTVDVEVVVTGTGASGSYYWSIIPNNKAATATGFGVATGTGAYFSGTKSSVAMNTASLKFGLGFIATTGTPTITIPYVQANAYKLV